MSDELKDERVKAVDEMEDAYLEIHDMIFSEMPIYPQADNFFLNHGHTLEVIVDEVRRWRKTHWDERPDGFRPDYCAASGALKEHLNTRPQLDGDREAMEQVKESLDYIAGESRIYADNIQEARDCALEALEALQTIIDVGGSAVEDGCEEETETIRQALQQQSVDVVDLKLEVGKLPSVYKANSIPRAEELNDRSRVIDHLISKGYLRTPLEKVEGWHSLDEIISKIESTPEGKAALDKARKQRDERKRKYHQLTEGK
jgi:hypothetical protein